MDHIKLLRNLLILLAAMNIIVSAQRNYSPTPMTFDVGRFHMEMNRSNGSDPSWPLGGLLSQFSWNLTGANPQGTEIFYWPQDYYQSNMLYQIYNPISLDDNGIKDYKGEVHPMYLAGDALRNVGYTDWASEVRRYRPPIIIVDGLQVSAPYTWYVDPKLKSDIKIEFEDVLITFGIRSHVEMYGFANEQLGDFFIWKTTHKFTGEMFLPRAKMPDSLQPVDQTIKFWWPVSFSFGPSKGGEKETMDYFTTEGMDDLDSWFKQKSNLVSGRDRDSLYIAYYWDSKNPTPKVYKNGSTDDTGDPDRQSGFLHSTQIPGFTLLYADKSADQNVDDTKQPYAMPHATITGDLWARREPSLKKTYRGDDDRGRFPLDNITEGFSPTAQKGPMRFITVGPYELTKDRAASRFDSVTFVYAVGVGSIGFKEADSIGKLWMSGQITDQEKNDWVMKGKDSLFNTLDKAYWAWNQLENGVQIPACPPPPDVTVNSGPDTNFVSWSYPDPEYFKDAQTGVDDWYAWRIYRKKGALLINDPIDQKNRSQWELIYETTDRNVTSYKDFNVNRGLDYYYAVTAVDNGSQNTSGLFNNVKMESSRYVTRTLLPVIPFKAGLDVSDKIRVVPNPATVASGAALAMSKKEYISFYNLPYKCKLQIFTETGDLVKVFDHIGTADEQWNQRTDSNQYVAPGIYILAASECETLEGKSLDTQFVKFVLVR